jgi:hypothetical protein
LVGHGLVVPRVRSIGDFRNVAEAVPVVVGIGVVLYAVSVQVFHYVGNGYDEGLCQRGVVLVCCLYAYVQGGGVGLVVEGCGGSDGAVGVDGEQVVVLGTIAVGEGQGYGCVDIGIRRVEFAYDSPCNLVLGD